MQWFAISVWSSVWSTGKALQKWYDGLAEWAQEAVVFAIVAFAIVAVGSVDGQKFY